MSIISANYHPGHDAGWSDDLGIITPQTFWLDRVPAGYYFRMNATTSAHEVEEWCEKNLHDVWFYHYGHFQWYVLDGKDATLFALRWS